MSHWKWAASFGLAVLAVSPGLAQPADRYSAAGAPAAGPDARYCLRVEPVTGSRVERIRCWTRERWAGLGVDVDREWAKEGVRVIE
ncbi:MAG TPA: hypothetical protein VEA61_10480 [Allosphingosinicella sp.]|nr:hypothetical protein [Allosphingosinicella sp.]